MRIKINNYVAGVAVIVINKRDKSHKPSKHVHRSTSHDQWIMSSLFREESVCSQIETEHEADGARSLTAVSVRF